LGDNRGAATNLEKYAVQNRDQLDSEAAMWSAADQWTLVGPAEAQSFYERYLEGWGTSNPDHAIAAKYELAKFAEANGDRRTEDAWAEVIALYNEFAPAGEIGPLGVHYAAAAAYRPVEAAFEEFKLYEFSENDDKNASLINEIKKPALYALEAQCVGLIEAYPDFDYSSAALYTLGASYLTFAKLLFEVPEPEGLDDEMLDMYLEAIDTLRIPVEDKGKARLIAVLEKAKTEKRWSDWTSKTVDFLAASFPSEFSKEIQEIRGATDSTLVPLAGPIAPEVQQAAPVEPEPAPEQQPTEGAAQPGVWQ